MDLNRNIGEILESSDEEDYLHRIQPPIEPILDEDEDDDGNVYKYINNKF